MYNQINLSTNRWIELLDCYLNDNQAPEQGLGKVVIKEDEKFVQIENSLFDRQMVIEITNDKAAHDFSPEHLEKTISIFKTFLIKQNEILDKTITPLLNRFSTRFSIWASSHRIFACITCIISFGILYKIWCTGHLTLQKDKKIKETMGSFQNSLTLVENRLKALNTSKETVEKQEIPENIECEVTSEEIASEILSKIKKLETEIVAQLNPQEFQEEIETIQNLPKQSIYTHPTTTDIEALEKEYLESIVDILYLNEITPTKKFLSIKNLFFGLLAVKANNAYFHKLPLALQSNKSIGLALTTQPLISEGHFKNDEDVCLAAIKTIYYQFSYVAEAFKTDRNFILKAAKINGEIIRLLSEPYKNDPEIVLECTTTFPLAITFSPVLKSDYKFSLQAVQKNGQAFEHIDPLFKPYTEIILAAAPSYAKAFEFASETLKKDQALINSLSAVNGEFLKYISFTGRNDFSTVLKAVSKSGLALEWASPTLRDNEKIVRAAIKQNKVAILFASPRLQKDEEMALFCIRQKSPGNIQNHLRTHWSSNKKILLEAVKYFRDPKTYLNPEMMKDREILLCAIKLKSYHLFEYLHFFKDDKEIMLAAVKQNPEHLNYASEKLKNNPEFILEVLSQNKRGCRKFFPMLSDQQKTNPEIISAFLKHDGLTFSRIPADLRKDKKLALEAVKQNDSAYKYLSAELRKDPDILEAIA